MHPIGKVVQEEGNGLVNLGRRDDVVVVQDQSPLPVGDPCPGCDQGVDQCGQRRGRLAGQGREDRSYIKLFVDRGERSDHVGQQPG